MITTSVSPTGLVRRPRRRRITTFQRKLIVLVGAAVAILAMAYGPDIAAQVARIGLWGAVCVVVGWGCAVAMRELAAARE